MGWSLDAFAAGYPPNTIPMTAQNAIAAPPTPQFIAVEAPDARL